MVEEKDIETVEQKEALPEEDRLVLKLAKSQRQTSIANARTAVAESETAEVNYKYVVLQIYMKHGLTNNDTIEEATGTIVRGSKKD